MALHIQIVASDATENRIEITEKSTIIQAQPDHQYRIVNDGSGSQTEAARLRNVDGNLIIEMVATGDTIELSDFYSTPDNPPSLSLAELGGEANETLTADSEPQASLSSDELLVWASPESGALQASDNPPSWAPLAAIGAGAFVVGAAAIGRDGDSAVASDGATAASTNIKDLEAGPAPLSVNAVAGDNVIGADEATDGILISGTAEAGANIDLRWHGSEAALAGQTVADSEGNWSYTFENTPGQGNSYLYVEDFLSGNDEVDGISIQIAGPAPLTMNLVEGDDIVTSSDAADGVLVTGTGEPGANIDLRWHGTEDALAGQTVVDNDGSWAYTFDNTPGQGDSTLYVEDFLSGNEDVPGRSIQVSTTAPLTIDPVEGDDIVNATEAADGVLITGTGQSGASIDLRWHGSEDALAGHTIVDDAGNWSYTFDNTPGEGGSILYVEDFLYDNEDVPGVSIQVEIELEGAVSESMLNYSTDISATASGVSALNSELEVTLNTGL